jgi:hypothetical protein
MYDKIELAIEVLTEKITKQTTPEEALKFTQAALNLAHAKAVLHGTKAILNNM